ncbi:UPF0758 protein [Frankliniella fusca]|uniref:UPF0758 protein n=1 Tax=Frankliniella fusca TaxID=407009 RepID=A0AAE1LRX0_9NEOP|nr:UPF0758 protein [Frankliniella fusca]
MSQDLFADSDPDDPWAFNTPLEFSGVSGASSSPSQRSGPSSQQGPADPTVLKPPTALLLPASTSVELVTTPQSYQCSKCKKKPYKTFRGFKNHMADKHNETVTETSFNQPADSAPIPRPTESLKLQYFVVVVAEANNRKPNASEFKEQALHPTIDTVVKEILAEPAYDDVKAKILQEFSDKIGTPEWNSFIFDLVDIICSFVCEQQTKLLPMNQYEVVQSKLNSYLNTQSDQLREKFMAIVCENSNNTHTNRLIFRIATKLLSQIQMWVVKKMSCAVNVDQPQVSESLSELEEKSFARELGHFLRKRFRKYKYFSLVYCACLKETFVDGQHPISTHEFLDEKNWFSGEEKCIEPSDTALQFFKAVEIIIRTNKEVTIAEDIIEIIFERNTILDHWFYLTNSHISEQESLLFMRDLLTYFLRMSLLFEEKRLNREEDAAIQANAAALRTHLQHNYCERDDTSENVE